MLPSRSNGFRGSSRAAMPIKADSRAFRPIRWIISVGAFDNLGKLRIFFKIINKKGNKVFERFQEEIFSEIENPELILILNRVKNYWDDTFRPALTQLSFEAVGGKNGIVGDAGLVFTLAAAGAGIHDDIIDKSSKKHFKRRLIMQYNLTSKDLVNNGIDFIHPPKNGMKLKTSQDVLPLPPGPLTTRSISQLDNYLFSTQKPVCISQCHVAGLINMSS